jgi:hypothetical protein
MVFSLSFLGSQHWLNQRVFHQRHVLNFPHFLPPIDEGVVMSFCSLAISEIESSCNLINCCPLTLIDKGFKAVG